VKYNIVQGKLYGIGVGPGDPELVTLKALRLMNECPVIGVPGKNPSESVALKIAKEACPEISNKKLLLIETPMTKDSEVLENGYAMAAEKIIACLKQGEDVAMLTLGDPTVYSTYIYIQRLVTLKGYEAEIINGIPSFCAVAAKFNDSLVEREEILHVIPASYQIDDALKLSGTKVLMKAASKLSDVKRTLMANGSSAVMVENCGMEGEKIYYSLDEIPEKGSYYSLIIVK
jgi:precorrin-2/cobalt-factor-2 C20-methyltransferase